VLALLRQEGLCYKPDALPQQGVISSVRRAQFALSAVGGSRLVQSALAAMALAFVLTWGALRWAENGPPSGTAPASLSASGAVAYRPDPELMEKWLAGPPTLAALARLERSFPRRAALSRVQRGAVEIRRG
jgi:hypothetical protein